MKTRILGVVLPFVFILNTAATALPVYAQNIQEEVIEYEVLGEKETEVEEKVYYTSIPEEQAEIIKNAYNIEEIELMAKTVWAEAGNQDLKGKRLVADVILNRLDSEIFPDTVEEVINQDGQFADGDRFTEDELYAVLLELRLGKDNRIDPGVVFFRTGYFHPYGTPAYKYGNHYFNVM